MTTETDAGTVTEPIRVEGLLELRDAAVELAAAARREILIVTTDLQPTLYDQQPFLEAVRRLATSGRRASIRVLVRDVERAVKEGHRLVELASRLSSFIGIRRMADDDTLEQHSLLLVDRKALLRQAVAASRIAEFCRHAPIQGRELAREFEELWARAEPDPNLRRLWL